MKHILGIAVISAVVLWFVLMYFWPYAAVLPVIIGGIVECIWPYTLTKSLDKPRQ